jgi:hypothetical protein
MPIAPARRAAYLESSDWITAGKLTQKGLPAWAAPLLAQSSGAEREACP